MYIERPKKNDRTPISHKALAYVANVFFRNPELFIFSSEPILDRVPVGIYIGDAKEHLYYGNPELMRMLGYENPTEFKTEILKNGGMQSLYCLPSAKDEWIEQHVQHKGEKVVIEQQLRRRDGQIITVRDTSIQVSEDSHHQPVYCGVLQDITKEVKLRNQREKEATTDYLTGLPNRRGLDEVLKKEIERAKRDQNPLSLLMLDCDHFKDVNDTYGHAVGNLVLQTIAAILKSDLRILDVPVRYGGEEFIIVLPNTSSDKAFVVAEKIRVLIKQLTISYGRHKHINLTISIGVAEFKIKENSDEFIARADVALYDAKNGGRNKTVIYTEGMNKPVTMEG